MTEVQENIMESTPVTAALASSKEAFIGDVCILVKLKVTSKGDALLTRRIGISAGLAV